MPHKILLWTGLILIEAMTTISLVPTIATAKDLTAPPAQQFTSTRQNTPTAATAECFSSGVKKTSQHDYKGAIADFTRCIQLNPNMSEAYNNRGVIKFEEFQDYKGALADHNRAIQIAPKDSDGYNNRGRARSKLHNDKGALADYNRCLQLAPRSSACHHNRGALKYTFLRDKAGAILDFQQAAKLYQKEGNVQRYQQMNRMIKGIQKELDGKA